MTSGRAPEDPPTEDPDCDRESVSSSSSVVHGDMANVIDPGEPSSTEDSQLPLNRLAELERLYLDGASKYKGSLSLDALLDSFIYTHQELSRCTLRTDVQLKTNFLDPLREVVKKVEELRLKKTDFEKIKLIGKGSFGEVSVVRLKGTNEIYALKQIDKASCIRRSDNARFHEERDVLVYGDRKWITNLHYAFQDQESLFFAMDYYPGGDLVALMSKFEESRVPENVVRFYVAEVALALDSLHQLGYIHRDFKPDNVMIDSKGHVKLGDFGACVKMNEKGKFLSTQACGTPDYISPDVLDVINNGQSEPVQIGKEIDYWGIGVLMFEMLFGEPPFYSEELSLTYCKILNHADTLDIPDNDELPQNVTDEARDLIRKLITNKDERLGRNGVEELKAHPFFNEIDWDNLENVEPPYNPSVSGPTDTSNFDDVDFEDERTNKSFHKNLNTQFTPFHLNFIGFTYSLMSSMSEMKPMRENAKQLDAEKSELLRKYQEANALVQSLSTESKKVEIAEMEVTIAKLKDQVQILTSQLTEERKAKATSQPQSQDGGLKELKQKVQRLATEKAELQRNLDIANDLVSSRDNEWKQTVQQVRERAEAEVEELTRELTDLKEKLERLETERSEKSDELATLNEQHLQMCKDLRNAITAKNTATSEVSTLTEELEALKAQLSAKETESITGENVNDSGETERLREELKTLNDRHMEIVAQEDKKRKQLVEHYQNQMAELQTQIEAREEDMQRIQKNLQNERTFHTQQLEQQAKNQEAQTDRIQRTLQESIAQLNIENQNLRSEVCRLKSEMERMGVEHKQELKNINGWMIEEAATRGEMEKITKQITHAIETMQLENGTSTQIDISPVKNAAVLQAAANTDPAASPMTHWGNRKTNRMARMEAQEAQLALEAEIRAKAELQDELNHFRTNYYGSKAKLDGALVTIDQLRKEIEGLRAANFAQQYSGGSADALNRTSSFFNIDGQRSSTPRDDGTSDGSPSGFSTMSKKGTPLGSRSDMPPSMYENTMYGGSPSTASTMLAGGRGSTPKCVQALNNALSARGHQFQHLSLDKPVKCDHCTSILVGLDRQGLACQCCQYMCHVNCAQRVPAQCPVPRESKRPLGIDPSKGVGTAYEGFVKTPKAGGVKKGWQNMYVAVCDFKLFLYDCNYDSRSKSNDVHPEIRHVLDMRDADFSVTGVAEQDVIHAQKSDLAKIFRISTSQIEGTSSESRQGTLLMADNPDERRKWVVALNELVRLLKKSRLPDRSAFRVKEMFDVMSLPMIRAALCAAVIDSNKIVLGFTDQGLYCVELDRETLVAVGGEKENSRRFVEQVEYCVHEQLLVVMVGPAKDRHVRLVPSAALDGRELKWIKVPESKGCHLMAVGAGGDGDHYYLAVAIKKTVVVYRIDRTEKRHHKWKEFAMPGLPQCMTIKDGRLIVGFPHTFRAWPLSTDSTQISLVNMEDQSLMFLSHTQFEAKLFVEVPSSEGKEYLLVFDKLGLYVDAQGRRNRAQELMFPANPKHFAYEAPYLMVYSENQVDVFNVRMAEWIQTINIRNPIPLNGNGLLTMCRVNDVPCVVMLKDVLIMDDPLHLPPEHVTVMQGNKKNKNANRRKFSIRTHTKDQRTGDRMSKLPISGPSDFVHIVHMGPGSVELKNMVDLPQGVSSSSSMLGGLLRSTSNTSANLHGVRPLGGTKMELDAIQKGRQVRPQSTASRSSDGSSSLGRDGTMTSSTSGGAENAYMEPMSKLNTSLQSPSSTLSPSARAPQ